MPKEWQPEQVEDPQQPKAEDPNRADVPDFKIQREDTANRPESAADE